MEKEKMVGLSVLALLVLFFAISQNSDFTGMVSTNIIDCYESDGGENPGEGSSLIGSFDPTKAKKDFCVNSTTVGEYYCDKARTDGKVKEIGCEFGCVTKNGFGVCDELEVVEIICDVGCGYNGECLPVGTRVSNRYCDFTEVLRVQKEKECDNNYECKSNLCLSGECLSEEGGINFLKDVENTYFWE